MLGSERAMSAASVVGHVGLGEAAEGAVGVPVEAPSGRHLDQDVRLQELGLVEPLLGLERAPVAASASSRCPP